MSTERIDRPAPGESLIGIQPELLQQLEPGWQRRLSFYTGRALTDTALSTEQQYRSGRLAVLSQLVTPGVGSGLDVSLRKDGSLRITAGYGFTATGEDVTLPRELTLDSFDPLDVVDAVTSVSIQSFAARKADTSVKGGVFVLTLLPVSGKATGAEIDTGSTPNEVSGLLTASCTRDPEEYAFEDWEIVDGAQLVLAAWPNDPAALRLPDSQPATTWQNRIASTIFDAELQLGPGSLPWEAIGVALGLVAFDSDWTLLFLDRNAVVRSGGRAHPTQLLNGAPGLPGDFTPASRATVEARLLQVMEQNAQIASQADLAAYVKLPPTAILPAAALDLQKKTNRWFPRSWTLHVSPLHAEEVETALQTSIFAAPFDLTQPEDANLLVPLTDDTYDPDVLVTEQLAQVFLDEQQKATASRDSALQHRKFLQMEANVLLRAQGSPLIDLDAGLSAEEKTGRDAAAYAAPADGSEAFGTSRNADGVFSSTASKKLLDTAAAAPYTVTARGTNTVIPLFGQADIQVMNDDGLQAFIDQINARINKVEDALNLNFLQTQTNIYRYRTNVLKGTDASRLVTSPIIANIAERESAVATAQDLAAYLTSIKGQPVAAAAPLAASATPSLSQDASNALPGPPPPLAAGAGSFVAPLSKSVVTIPTRSTSLNLDTTVIRNAGNLGGLNLPTRSRTSDLDLDLTDSTFSKSAVLTAAGLAGVSDVAIEQMPSKSALPSAGDVTSQLPLSNVTFNLRTLNIAERLKPSPSHEALLYVLSTRTNFIDSILAGDFGITVDDLEILVQEQVQTPGAAGPTFKLTSYPIAQLRAGATKASVYSSIQTAGLLTDADESGVFSAGITALDHHSLLLRAVEVRIALYRQFLGLVSTALSSIQGDTISVQAAIARAGNDLSAARGNLSLVLGLIIDENARIQAVNARRAATLQSVPFLVLMRPQTLQVEADVPARQLFPASVASPVPDALQSTALVPPELRELAALLREAPPAWLPATEALLARLERPQYFLNIATTMRVRAYTRLQLPSIASSATTHPGPFGAPLANVFATQQSAMNSLVQQRASYDHTRLASLGWADQKTQIFNVAAINDLIASDAVHLEIANEITSIVQNVSKVATALYIRVSAILPIQRLQWAEYLRDGGQRVGLRSLAALPGWNTVDYIERQQMQLLVDWLFTQINTSIADAVSYMSDMVRTAILLASHAPVTDIIAGEVAARSKPVVGSLIPVTSASSRIAHGMPVLFYQGGALAARAVVDDLDAQQVYAKVTDVYQDAFLEQNAQVHFLNDDPQGALIARSTLARR